MQQTKKWAGILLIFLTITAFLAGGAAVYDGWNYISVRTIQPGWRMAVPLFTAAKSAPSEWGCGSIETTYGYFAIPANWNYIEMRVYVSASNASLSACAVFPGRRCMENENAKKERKKKNEKDTDNHFWLEHHLNSRLRRTV